jgi:hypothetical protein
MAWVEGSLTAGFVGKSEMSRIVLKAFLSASLFRYYRPNDESITPHAPGGAMATLMAATVRRPA